MNFSCPSCQAKYQVADEKVAGRSLKMKCRKCGHLIPIQGSAVSIAPLPTHSMAPAAGASIAPLAGAPLPKIRVTGALAPGAPSMPPVAKAQAPRLVAAAPRPEVLWHVGIGGKVVGPLSRAQVIDHVLAGDVTAETFAWCEGMPEWKPLPELAELRAVLASAHAPTAPERIEIPKSSNESLEESLGFGNLGGPLRGEVTAPKAAAPSAATGARSSPVVSEPRSAKPTENAAVAAALAPFVAPEPNLSAKQQHAGPVLEPSHFGLPPSRHVGVGTIVFAVLGALAFGMAVSYVLFAGGDRVRIVKQVIEVPVEQQANVPPPPAAEAAATPEQGSQATQQASGSKPKPGQAGAQQGPSATTPAAGSSLSGLSGLSGLGTGGPSGGPSGPSGSSGSGQPLDASQVQRTVSTYQSAVKRGCWQPALDTRDKSAPSSARVTVAIQVAASGSVSSAKGSGDPPGYSGLSSCIERKVLTWKFPASSGSTQVNVPFVFAAQ